MIASSSIEVGEINLNVQVKGIGNILVLVEKREKRKKEGA